MASAALLAAGMAVSMIGGLAQAGSASQAADARPAPTRRKVPRLWRRRRTKRPRNGTSTGGWPRSSAPPMDPAAWT